RELVPPPAEPEEPIAQRRKEDGHEGGRGEQAHLLAELDDERDCVEALHSDGEKRSRGAASGSSRPLERSVARGGRSGTRAQGSVSASTASATSVSSVSVGGGSSGAV